MKKFTVLSILSMNFAQWLADNVDHNIITLDGKNTFHSVGIVVSTPSAEDNLVAPLPQIRQKTERSGLDMEL